MIECNLVSLILELGPFTGDLYVAREYDTRQLFEVSVGAQLLVASLVVSFVVLVPVFW